MGASQAYGQALKYGERETGTRLFAVSDKNHIGGYSMGQLMMDTRQRLAMALHSAGLDNTKAGREAMMQVKGSLLPRRDTFTSDQLGLAAMLSA